MLNFRLYDKELDINLEEWSTKEYSIKIFLLYLV